MTEAFRWRSAAHLAAQLLMSLPALPLVVHAWYDDLPQKVLRLRPGWAWRRA